MDQIFHFPRVKTQGTLKLHVIYCSSYNNKRDSLLWLFILINHLTKAIVRLLFCITLVLLPENQQLHCWWDDCWGWRSRMLRLPWKWQRHLHRDMHTMRKKRQNCDIIETMTNEKTEIKRIKRFLQNTLNYPPLWHKSSTGTAVPILSTLRHTHTHTRWSWETGLAAFIREGLF